MLKILNAFLHLLACFDVNAGEPTISLATEPRELPALDAFSAVFRDVSFCVSRWMSVTRTR
jgi:hypothetical protein